MPTYEVEQHMFAAAQHIVKVLGANKNLNDDFRRVLTELDSHLSAMTLLSDSKGGIYTEIEERLKRAEREVLRWESCSSLIWESGSEEASGYLQAVNEIQALVESLGGLSGNETGRTRELAGRAQSALQMAMQRLEEELYHILLQHKQPFVPQNGSFSSRANDVVYDQSFVSVEDEIVEEESERDNNGGSSVEYTADLVDPRVIPAIKAIANAMLACKYGKELCEVFISSRQLALEEYFSILKVRKLSIEDVLKLELNSWNSEVKKWVWTMKMIIKGYLASERRFCDQIFGDFGSICSSCFVEISKVSILGLIDFGDVLAMGPHKPENLICLLDMVEVLSDLHLHVDGLFSEESGSFLRIEFHEFLKRVCDSAKTTFLKFENAIASDASVHPFPGGGIHHLTKYVMNYLRILTVYSGYLYKLLKDQEAEASNAVVDAVNGQGIPSSGFCPVAYHFRSVAATLEASLISKSELYKEVSLRSIFLLNNMHYIVQKVKSSELRLFFGDEWIRKHIGKFQQHATSYVRTTWSPVVSLLRDDGKASVKERCKRFTNAFEEVHKVQAQWCIADPHLREDLQISISQKVIPAYRSFLGNRSSEKYVKYTAEDLEELLLDLFVKSPRSLRNSRRW
ncbi:hypothetical protein Tsubulata_017499 [Turnera subulata]|uniref:Exocyst subunit Exo70 family protein n=1 Tax=Turnera subulata TaxID=218843 RepID=A0A9Q0FI10_9ROSI|nr:hypothetical protein Tsubulata_017499 [Turnera subulata]